MITDGDTHEARCGEEGSHQQIKVPLAAIGAPGKVQPFGQRSTLQDAETLREGIGAALLVLFLPLGVSVLVLTVGGTLWHRRHG